MMVEVLNKTIHKLSIGIAKQQNRDMHMLKPIWEIVVTMVKGLNKTMLKRFIGIEKLQSKGM